MAENPSRTLRWLRYFTLAINAAGLLLVMAIVVALPGPPADGGSPGPGDGILLGIVGIPVLGLELVFNLAMAWIMRAEKLASWRAVLAWLLAVTTLWIAGVGIALGANLVGVRLGIGWA